MKNKLLALLVVVLILTIASCNLKAKDDDTDTGGADSVSEVLKNIPEVKPALPKSLQLPDSDKALRSSKAANDITELTTANVSPVKSQAWVDLQEGDDVQLMFNRAVKFIANYATANDIAIDQEFSAPIDATALADIFKIPVNMALSMTVSNKCVIKGSDPKDIVLYCKISIKNSHGTIPISAKVGIKTAADSSVRLTVNLDIAIGGGMTQRMYVDFDSATSACTSVVSMQDSSGADQGTFIRTATLGGDGSISTVNRSTGSSSGVSPMPGFTHIAYGDDNYGGIASLSSFTNPLNSTTNDFYYGEYYNSSGNLMRRDNGNSAVWSIDSQVLDHQKNISSLGIPSSPLPTHIYVREKTGGTGYQHSTNGTTWTDFAAGSYGYVDPNNYWNGFYYKANTASTSLSPGDALYYLEKIESISDGDYVGKSTYYLGYVVPTATTLFGKSLYLDYEYPLNSLLPIVGNYTLIQKQVGDSQSFTWEDWEGNSITNTFAYYLYYLNNNSSGLKDQIEPGLDIDLSNNLTNYDVYYFSGGKLSQAKGYFFRTSQDLPGYFTPLTSTVTTAIGGVKTKLTDLMNTALALDSADYASLLVSLAGDSVLGGLTP